jgi:hypothetical protein
MATKYRLEIHLLSAQRGGPAPTVFNDFDSAKAARDGALEHGMSQEDGTENDIVDVAWPASAIACGIITKFEEE